MLTFIYADDIVIVNLFSCSNTSSLTRINDFEIITRWFISNGFHLNLSKFSSLMVGFSSSLTRLYSFNIINSNPINILSYMRILGIHFDSSWSLKHHVSVKYRAAYVILRMLYPFRHILSLSQKILVSQLLVIYLFIYFYYFLIMLILFTSQIHRPYA